MPGYKGHLVGGAAVGIALVYILRGHYSTSIQAGQWMVCALAGSLFPDIDIKSKGQKYFYWIVIGIFLTLIFYEKHRLLGVVSVVAVMPMLSKHRGLFHEPWFVIVLPILVWLGISSIFPSFKNQFYYYMIFFIAGALSHLILDRGWKGLLPNSARKKLFFRKKRRYK